jgi:hypothetical protein
MDAETRETLIERSRDVHSLPDRAREALRALFGWCGPSPGTFMGRTRYVRQASYVGPGAQALFAWRAGSRGISPVNS